jgi:DNA-binding CsgD family transcriptional regulator
MTHAVHASRYRVAVCQAKGGAGPQRLTACELSVVRLCAVGLSSGEIGHELGVAAVTVRGALGRARRKLGVQSCAQLPLLWQALDGQGRRHRLGARLEVLVFEAAPAGNAVLGLTRAQLEVIGGVMQGKTTAELAQERLVSPSTIASQLAVLFARFRAGSRVELMARLFGVPSSSLASQTQPRTWRPSA